MNKVAYLFKRMREIDLSNMRRYLARLRAQTGRHTPRLLLDIGWCALRYGAGYTDYTIFGMYDMNARQRRTVLTGGKNNRYVAACNAPDDCPLFDDKVQFLSRFADFTGRDYLHVTDQTDDAALAAFTEQNPVFMAKPQNGMCGKGIEKLNAANFPSAAALREYLLTHGQTLLETVIEQHPTLRALHPSSINTIRIVTLKTDTGVHPVYAGLRVGSSGNVVDNFNAGGMTVPVDLLSGDVQHPAIRKDGSLYSRHPDTGVPFVGLTIPCWGEIIALIKRAGEVIPTVRYVGWDIAITPGGPVLVEGNAFPGNDIVQLKEQTPDRIGILPQYERILPYRTLRRIKH